MVGSFDCHVVYLSGHPKKKTGAYDLARNTLIVLRAISFYSHRYYITLHHSLTDSDSAVWRVGCSCSVVTMFLQVYMLK